ncbi:hypothetical protein [Nitrosophilus alvini]|uniref:hypothetical protein n=1 Tax=Nitrosophilus alvini TaxID=2714855 RepID=UPI00190D0F1E|nr:hypothetical protein [Nitrosophilus alvini]
MRKAVLILLLFKIFLFGYNYNELLLKAQASLFPKLLLLDKKLNEKLVNGSIVYTIVYNENDEYTALEVRNMIVKYHDHQLGNYNFSINMVKYSEISYDFDSTAVYALNSAEEDMSRLGYIVLSKGIISFAYDIKNLKYGFLFSLMIENTTVIYMNKNTLKLYKTDFIDELYHLVRLVDAK